MSFTIRFALVLVAALLIAGLISPVAAMFLAGFDFPFARIFDRVAMITVFIAIGWQIRELDVIDRLRRAFQRPRANWTQALRGFGIGLVCIVVLLAIGLAETGNVSAGLKDLWPRLPAYVAGAIIIGAIEEAFFRGFLLNGITEDFGARTGLIVSAIVYAIAHVVRSPAHFHLTGFHALAGLQLIATSFGRLLHPREVLPAAFGLFLLGLVLGEACLATGTVYLSLGLHAGFVLGAKIWRMMAPGAFPDWLTGYGRPPLISGPAAWVVAIALLIWFRTRSGRRAPGSRVRKAARLSQT
jgi:membrane protease YdiL (CAAX protease family)